MIRMNARIILLFSIVIVFALSLYSHSVNDPIMIGVSSMIEPADTVKHYQKIVDYLSDKLGMPVEMEYDKTFGEIDKLLETGDIDAAFICSASYVRSSKEYDIDVIVAPQVDGRVYSRSYIIVHKDSDIKSFDELKGKTFAFSDPLSHSGHLYPVYLIAKKGYRPEKFFKRYIYTYSQGSSIEKVATRAVDGAAVEDLIYKYMKSKNSPYMQQIRLIGTSPDFGISPMVASPALSTFMKGKIKDILVNMHRDAKGREILATMLTDKFIEVPENYYDSIREMELYYYTPDDLGTRNTSLIYFGIIPRDNPRIAYEKYQPIIDYLSESTPLEFELVLKKTYDETVNALGQGGIDLAFLGPLTYLHARAEYGVVPVLKSVTEKGEPFYRSVVVAKENQSIDQISDLKGMVFAFSALKSTSGNLIPRYLLADEGIHLRELVSYKNFSYHDSAVKWVLKGRFDAGAVRESVAEKYLPLGLKIIAISKPIPTGPVVAGPETPYEVVETVKKALLDLSRTEKGRKILENVDPDIRGGFIAATDSDYQSIRKMINDVPKTCGLGCHPKIKL
jgi:phosphonate transport system substrate-binding protein